MARRLAASLAGDAVAGPGFEYKVRGAGGGATAGCVRGGCQFHREPWPEVNTAVASMSFPSGDSDALFFEALALCWKALEAHLLGLSPPVMSYNRMFALFGENNPENLRLLPDPLLRPLGHLMIDEFQDVSPQIVSWLRASCAKYADAARPCTGRHAQHSSLLCVGDDWRRSMAGAAVHPSTSWNSPRPLLHRPTPA